MADVEIRTETQGPLLMDVVIGFVVLSSLVLASRFYTRVVLLGTPGADDWTILASIVFSIIVTVATCMEVVHGMGRHVEAVPLEDTIPQLTYLYVSVLNYNIGMNIVKISFLYQYRRIFQTPRMQLVCFWAIIAVIIWAAVQVTLLGISCLPIAFIVPSTAEWCLDTLPIWYFSSAMSLATDILIFCIPLPSVIKLQLPIRQKVMVVLIFCLGFFVCIISVYRIWTLRDAVESADPPWDNVGAAMWSSIELNTAIICASLPTLRPLAAKFIPGLSSQGSRNNASYERYGSQYASGSRSRHGKGRSIIGTSKGGPRSISTEELALSDLDAALQQHNPRTAYVRSESRTVKQGDSKGIVITTETSIKREERDFSD